MQGSEWVSSPLSRRGGSTCRKVQQPCVVGDQCHENVDDPRHIDDVGKVLCQPRLGKILSTRLETPVRRILWRPHRRELCMNHACDDICDDVEEPGLFRGRAEAPHEPHKDEYGIDSNCQVSQQSDLGNIVLCQLLLRLSSHRYYCGLVSCR